jgi:hypothetical protein
MCVVQASLFLRTIFNTNWDDYYIFGNGFTDTVDLMTSHIYREFI